MKKMMFLSKNWYFSVQKALIYYTVNKSHHMWRISDMWQILDFLLYTKYKNATSKQDGNRWEILTVYIFTTQKAC